MATITLKQLHTQGRLSLGDILTHSVLGDHELLNVLDDTGRIKVRRLSTGRVDVWSVDFGDDTKLVPVAIRD